MGRELFTLRASKIDFRYAFYNDMFTKSFLCHHNSYHINNRTSNGTYSWKSMLIFYTNSSLCKYTQQDKWFFVVAAVAAATKLDLF